MARTFEEILEEIDQKASAYEALANIQKNSSRTSIWKYIKNTVAFIIHTLERMFDKHMKDVRQAVSSQEIGTLRWYHKKALEFQLGDKLLLIDNKPRYNQENAEKRIIAQASVAEEEGAVRLKVVKEDENKALTSLSTVEYNSFVYYINKIKFAGIRVNVDSGNAQEAVARMVVEVNPEILDLSGRHVFETGSHPVEEAARNFFRNLPFDARFYISKLEDAIQVVDGVTDVSITSVMVGAQTVDRHYVPQSGHIKLDEENSVFSYVNRPAQ